MSDELTWMPAWRMRELIAASEVSCTEVTEHFLGRIEKLNPTLQAFEQVDWDGAPGPGQAGRPVRAAATTSGRCTASRPP